MAREKQLQLAGIKAEEEEVTTTARNLMRAALYPGHPYSLPAQGTPGTVGEAHAGAARRFLQQICRRRKTACSPSYGDVKAAEVKAQVERLFAAMPAGEEALDEPARSRRRSPRAKPWRSIANKAQAILMVAYRGADMFSPDRAALELIDEASSDLGSRFFIRIREKMGLAYFVGATPDLGAGAGAVRLLPRHLAAETGCGEGRAARRNQQARPGRPDAEAELTRAKQKAIGQQDIRNQSEDAPGLLHRAG